MKGIKRFRAYKLYIIYIYMCVCVCVCVHARLYNKKYKRKMCYYQKNNSDIKTFEMPKNIKVS